MWKRKTKWLVRGGRKVRCYLCGKKILAKGDLFLFHQVTGYYSHQSCMTESTTISGNERRRAVKKIAAGAAIATVIAAGAGKFLDVSSQSKNSPAAQTILTSQGLILPALTSDPANPVAGQMWYRSDKGVTAHFDAIENRVIYSNRIVNGSAVVTSKGIVNGLSVLPNDGQDWGPDTTKGATAPGQYGSPYTETLGINEAGSYLSKAITSANGNVGGGGKIVLVDPLTYQISAPIVIDAYSSSGAFSVTIEGVSWKRIGTQICPSSSFPSDSYLLTINGGSGSLQAGFILKNFVLNGQVGGGFGGTPYASGFLVQNGNYGTIDSVSYENCVVGRNFSITTGGTQQVSGFAANNEIFENYTTGIVNEYGGVTTVNPSFYPNSNTSVAIQEQGMQNVEYINPLLICSVYPVFMQVYVNGNRSIKISNLFHYGTYPSSGSYPIIQSYSTNENYNTMIYIDGITLAVTNPSTATTQLIQTVDNTGENQGGYFFISKFNPILDTLLILDNTIDTFVHLILSDAYLSNLTTLNFSTGSSSDNFLYFYNCIGLPAPTTPSVPTSATAQENTNPYAVDVYVYGGDVTEIQITKNGTAYTVFSVSTAIATSGQGYRLNPGDSITVTYSTAPTWEWLSD